MADKADLMVRIDDYIADLFSQEDEALKFAVENSERKGLPGINVSANEGKLLYLLVKMSGAKKILEVGTLGAYSTIWMARALPAGGKVITLEYSDKHATVARENIAKAGLSSTIEVRLGAGLDLMPALLTAGEGPFDLFFIDADKENYPGYLEWALKLARPGSLILTDNVIRGGGVLEPKDSADPVIAKYNQTLASHPRLESLILPITRDIVDGIAISIVKE